MTTEKEAFSTRLRDAMIAAGHEPRPVVLERLFNSHYWGPSVSFQAVSRWLNGRSIPSQEKLQVLAALLTVEPQALRYGEAALRNIRDKRARWDAGLAPEDRDIIEAFLGLSVEEKKAVREVIRMLARPKKG